MIAMLPRTILVLLMTAAMLPRALAGPVKPWLPFGYNGVASVCYDEPCELYGTALVVQGDRRLLYPAQGRLLALDLASGQPDPQFRAMDVAALGATRGTNFVQLAVLDDGTMVAALQSTRDQGVLLGLDADGQASAGFLGTSGVYRGLVAMTGTRFAAYRTDLPGAGEIWRFQRDGRPDASFGDGGRALAALAIGLRITAFAPDAAGRLLVAGSQALSAEPGIAGRVAVVLRLRADGTPDPAFGTNGVVSLPFAGFGGEALEVLPEPDGAVAVVANAAREPGTVGVAVLARIDATGRLDANFGTAGIAWPGTASCTGADYEAQSATRLASGGIAIGAGGWTRTATAPPRERLPFSAGAALLGVDARGAGDLEFGSCGRYRFYDGAPVIQVARVREHRGDLFATTVYVPVSTYLYWDYWAEIWRLSRARAASPGSLRASQWESDSRFTVEVDRTGGDVGRVELRYSTADGTATAGREYQAASGSFTWDDGVIGMRTLNVAKVASTCVAVGAAAPTITVQFESLTPGVDAPVSRKLTFTKPVCTSAASAPTSTPPPAGGGGGGGALELWLCAALGGAVAARAAQRRSRSAGGSATSG